jgi:SAM-dependent methyltransferase
MASLYYQYYDRLYAGKDYAAEVATLNRISDELSEVSLRRVLDVGCGTGTHALLFAEAGCQVTAIDIDPQAIAIARVKCKGYPAPIPQFYCGDVAKLDETEFHLAVSLFNVINYVDRQPALARLLDAVFQRLVPGGLYIFDCWNGLAALLDPPRQKQTQIAADDETITIATTPKLDLMRQAVHVTNQVTVTRPGKETQHFSHDYTSILWTPWHLRQMLSEAGFDHIDICQWMQPDQPADERSWKIMFVCRR